ncbi:MAG: hypothetical protein DBX49_01035 [Clostridia bacterium]|nr:MAG: hypothetical protein DBX49_01035 [Clostridia bacterium]
MDPFKSVAVPRPIAWISTVSKDGIDNLAPFSQFTNVGFNHPPNGKLDILKLRPLARLGYADYTSVTDVWEMRPQSMMDKPIPGGYSYMSPESLKLEATHRNL